MTQTKEFFAPPALEGVLMDFSREVMRSNPVDIHAFGEKYFMKRIDDVRRAENEEALASDSQDDKTLSFDEILVLCDELFSKYDEDNSGFLDKREFKKWFKDLKKWVPGLQDKDRKKFFAEADPNGDGEVDISEFRVAATAILQAVMARNRASAEEQEKERQLEEAAMEMMIEREPEMRSALEAAWAASDTNGDGVLDLEEFKVSMRTANEGLTDDQLKSMFFEVDVDDSGSIDKEEFMSFAIQFMLDCMKESLMEDGFGWDQANDMSFMFTNAIYNYDTQDEKDGGFGMEAGGQMTECSYDRLVTIMEQWNAELPTPFTGVQLLSIVSVAQSDENGNVQYNDFAVKAARVYASLQDVQVDMDNAQAAKEKVDSFMANLKKVFQGKPNPTQDETEFYNNLAEVMLDCDWCDDLDIDGSIFRSDMTDSAMEICSTTQGFDISELKRLGPKFVKKMLVLSNQFGDDMDSWSDYEWSDEDW